MLVVFTTILGIGLGKHQFFPRFLATTSILIFAFNIGITDLCYTPSPFWNVLGLVFLALWGLKAVDAICVKNVCYYGGYRTNNLQIYNNGRDIERDESDGNELCGVCKHPGNEFKKLRLAFNFMWNFRGVQHRALYLELGGQLFGDARITELLEIGQVTESLIEDLTGRACCSNTPTIDSSAESRDVEGVPDTANDMARWDNELLTSTTVEEIYNRLPLVPKSELTSEDKLETILWVQFLFFRLGGIIFSLLFLEATITLFPPVLTLMSREHQHFLSRLSSITFREVIFRSLFVSVFWANFACIVSIIYNIPAVIFVGCGFHDHKSWPPILGSLKEAYSLRRFWRYGTTLC